MLARVSGLARNGTVPEVPPSSARTMTLKHTSGLYEPADNILHLWFTRRVELVEEPTVDAFFDEVYGDWIAPCPTKPYLLVNYANVFLHPKMTAAYVRNIGRFRASTKETFRYNVSPDFTGVTVALGNMELATRANIFPNEASARDAIRQTAEAERMRR
jgi:hypothetical protein